MNIEKFIKNDRHIVAKRLQCLVNKVEEIHYVNCPNSNTIILKGNVFDVIASVYLLRDQYIKHGLGWNEMTLFLDSTKPYQALLKYEIAKESCNNKLKFQIKSMQL